MINKATRVQASVNKPRFVSAGGSALALIAGNKTARVVVRFTNSAYIECNGQFVCVVLHALGAGPISLQFNQSTLNLPACFTAGATVRSNKGQLVVGECSSFEYALATVFHETIQPAAVNRNHIVRVIHELAMQTLPHDGLACLLRLNVFGHKPTSSLAVQLMPAIECLLGQLDQRRARGIKERFYTQSWQQIIGAGPGLTPSGDDFMCGVFTALYLQGLGQEASAIYGELQPEITHLTTPVSIALLKQASAGNIAESSLKILSTVVSSDQFNAEDVAAKLECIGHTSGWDWLCGVLLGLDALCADVVHCNTDVAEVSPCTGSTSRISSHDGVVYQNTE